MIKIIVCMKQVPAGTSVEIDPETGAMKRLGSESCTNPYDLFALENRPFLKRKTGRNGHCADHGAFAGGRNDERRLCYGR